MKSMTEFKDTDFIVESLNARTGRYRVGSYRFGDHGVRLVHVPTGQTEVCNESRSQLANMRLAKERLMQRLKTKID